jgi:putative addiction module component (TIGR02574 family)
MSADTIIAEASKLSPEDRLRVAQALWQSAWDDEVAVPLTTEQREELDRRLADHEANPDAVIAWEDVRDFLERKL